MKLSDFASYFRDEAEEQSFVALAEANDVLSWMSSPYHAKFIEWLERESNRPVKIVPGHMDLVQEVTRVNAFREIRQHIAKIEAEAKNALDQAGG